MKTDSELKKDVIAELNWDAAVKSDLIGVAVSNGVVTLTGHLTTYAEKEAVSRAVRRLTGVKAIALELDVKLSPEHKRSDTEIATSAKQALLWNSLVPNEQIHLTVEHGWITLRGETDWDYQRKSAESALRSLVGVVGITNEITLRAKPQAADLSRKIQDALTRQALADAKSMQISVEGSTVRLSGTVQSWQERNAAQGVAWSAPGVRFVVNDLRIA
jgi:osmotically-inducible protein OsmY